jgi:hypothetical protein
MIDCADKKKNAELYAIQWNSVFFSVQSKEDRGKSIFEDSCNEKKREMDRKICVKVLQSIYFVRKRA